MRRCEAAGRTKERFGKNRKPRIFTELMLLSIESQQGVRDATNNLIDSYRAVVSALFYRVFFFKNIFYHLLPPLATFTEEVIDCAPSEATSSSSSSSGSGSSYSSFSSLKN